MEVVVDNPAPLPTLRDHPDWRYLLREYYEMYRLSSAAGSAAIRSHQKVVREAISKVIADNPVIQHPAREDKPVARHLKRALNEGRMEKTANVIRAIESVLPELSWLYGYEKVPRGLSEKFAYAEVAGPQGPIVTDRVILGLVLFAPRCTYPSHSHDGLTESYFTLSGAVSENDNGVYAPGSLIFNPPGRMHRLTTGDHEPTLLAYAWSGPREKLGAQKMVFTRSRKGRTT